MIKLIILIGFIFCSIQGFGQDTRILKLNPDSTLTLIVVNNQDTILKGKYISFLKDTELYPIGSYEYIDKQYDMMYRFIKNK